jgi:phenylalanyl-tRNA synthetase beta chain
MKFGLEWLADYVDLNGLSVADLADKLTMAGLEVEAVEAAAPEFAGVVIGEVMAVSAHPSADKLKICQINDGSAELKTVVCGAANVRVGLKVPYATVGARLPNGVEIKAAELRGQKSFGMLCSSKELGLGVIQEGLWECDAALSVGTPLQQALRLNDTVLTLNATPNRPDVLSLQGIAREVAAMTGASLRAQNLVPVPSAHNSSLTVTLAQPAACPVFAGRVITGVNPNAKTPQWLQERLRRAGLRSISPLVDVTNYVMLGIGQPMHAYDLKRLVGGITVRLAKPQETLTLLDGSQIALSEDMLVIADQAGAVGLAGVMGGERSAIAADTTEVFLEAAWFEPAAVAGRGRRLGIITDASLRFERGVDPALAAMALEWATQLLLEIAGGVAGPTVVTGQAPVRERKLTLRTSAVERLLAVAIAPATIERILASLALKPLPHADGFTVSVPSFRFDLNIEADLVEEIARVYGLNNIPDQDTPGLATPRAIPEGDIASPRLLNRLIDRGYQEVLNFTFVDPRTQAKIHPEIPAIRLQNPISQELSVMRLSLLPGLLTNLQDNLNRQVERVRITEMGAVFIPQPEHGQREQLRLGGLHYGSVSAEQWGETKRWVDFYDIKADVEALLAAGLPQVVNWRPCHESFMHPTRSASVERAGETLGFVGELHPKLLKILDLDRSTIVFELTVAGLAQAQLPKGHAPSKQPLVRRDLAVVVDEGVSFEQIRQSVFGAGCEFVQDLVLFDVYRGQGIENGRKSLAIGLILQDKNRTLTDPQVDTDVSRIRVALSGDVAAAFRE